MPTYPLDFVQCPKCTHVWNRSFAYADIPYEKSPNRMFNAGVIWQGHLATTRDMVLAKLPATPTVIDIGCGEGHFLRGLAAARNSEGRFVGFDPNATSESGRGVEFHAQYFKPLEDVPAYRPDALVLRHVLEHLTDPAAFIEEIAWSTTKMDKQPVWLFAEMPCIDRALETRRLADFYYEHPSQFTTESFRTLLSRGGEVEELAHGYGEEVVYGLVRLGVTPSATARADCALRFERQAVESVVTIRAQLDDLAAQGLTVAIWGGTGKAAAFIQRYGVDADRFPLVVDSDADKVGTFVPGAGQRIQFRDGLIGRSTQVLIIPAQWRAKDIVDEMRRTGIACPKVLIEHEGRLVDYFLDVHPYR